MTARDTLPIWRGSNYPAPINAYTSDPDFIQSIEDIKALEQVSVDDRFPYKSTTQLIEAVAKTTPDHTAITYLPEGTVDEEPVCWTYKDYWEEVVAVANAFNSLGLAFNQSVNFVLPNIPEMLFGIWGAEAAGIAAPLNPLLKAQQLAGIAQEADTHIFVTLAPDALDGMGQEYWEKAVEVRELVPSVQHIVTIGGTTPEGAIDWAELVASQPRDRFIFDRTFTGEEVASYFHTGGTTGTPKLACHTHRAEVVNICQMSIISMNHNILEDMPLPVVLVGLPFFHVNAVFVSGLLTIFGSGNLVIASPIGFREKRVIEGFWALVEKYKVTYFAGVPTLYAALMDQSSAEFDLSSLDSCGCGASPMPASQLDKFHDLTGALIIEGYGMTETTVCASSNPRYGKNKVGSIGMRVPYTELKIAVIGAGGEFVRECETNEIGVLLLKGPNIIPRYKQEEANEKAWPLEGWLNTGDMGRVDEDGYIWLTGRAKDLIIRGGHNIDPMIVEDALSKHPQVNLVAAVGKPDAYAGELPVAYVELQEGATVTAEELRLYARENVAERPAAPAEVIIVDEIPKTGVGKIFKPALRKDIIARAYAEIANGLLPEAGIKAEVVEDKKVGMKVILTSRSGTGTDVQDALKAELSKFSFHWELAA